MSIRIRKNLLGSIAPQVISKSVSDIVNDGFYNRINLRPVYQRHIRWSPNAMNDFIGTIMNRGLIPCVYMYKLSAEEQVDNRKFEMVDGQHRIYTIKSFVDSTLQKLPHIAKPFIVYWNYEHRTEDGTIEYIPVFYKRTDDVENWCRETKKTPHYLTDEELEYVNDSTINISIINSQLTIDQRREIFMSLQKGVPVRNSDYLKNKTDCKLIAFINENSYETMMRDVFLAHCHKKALNYWVHWVTRCFLLYCYKISNDVRSASEIFLIKDTEIKKIIDSNITILSPKNDNVIYDFDDIFRSFIGFLQMLDDNIKFNPTQIFALFYRLCDNAVNHEVLLTHMTYFSKEGSVSDKRKMWESTVEQSPRRKYFNECVEQLEAMIQPALPVDNRPITQKLKQQVWLKCVDNKCHICQTTIAITNFEAGHIVARALGGSSDLSNLIPICFNCNRSMGIRNAYEYKLDVYPELRT